MSRRIALACTLLLACTAREREPVAAEPKSDPQAKPAPTEPPLVTIELGLTTQEAQQQLAAIHGPDSPLGRADMIMIVHHRITAPWHIYWVNPGESGLRTKLSFDATNVEVGPVVYPTPDRFVAEGGVVTYGWEHDAVLFVPLINKPGEATIEVRSDWLACHESCIPGHSEASSRVDHLVRRNEELVRSMVERIPEPAGERLRSSWDGTKLRVEPTIADARMLAFFPYASDKAVLQTAALGEAALDLDYRFDGSPPAELGQGVITFSSAGQTRWLELATPWPSL